jgi:hypothetical protein
VSETASIDAGDPVLVTVKVVGVVVTPSIRGTKVIALGETESVPAAYAVPVRATDAEPPGAAETVSEAVTAPASVGVKATSTPHVAPPASLCPEQVSWTIERTDACGPASISDSGPVGAVPLLVTAIAVRALDEPREAAPRSALDTFTLTLAVPAPAPSVAGPVPPSDRRSLCPPAQATSSDEGNDAKTTNEATRGIIDRLQ